MYRESEEEGVGGVLRPKPNAHFLRLMQSVNFVRLSHVNFANFSSRQLHLDTKVTMFILEKSKQAQKE